MKDENVKDIPKGLCVRPWQQLGILPSGNTRFCCMSSRLIRDEIGVVSINDQDIDNIWNASSIRSVRKCMAEGEMPAECSGCYEAEKSTGESPRTRINEDFSNGFLNPNNESVMAFIERVTHHDGTSHELPVDLDLEL